MILGDLIFNLPVTLAIGDLSTEINGITDDSRKVRAHDLFICICGMVTDGHHYISEAIQNGAAAILVDETFWKNCSLAQMDYPQNKLSTPINQKNQETIDISALNNKRHSQSNENRASLSDSPSSPSILVASDTRIAAAIIANHFYHHPSHELKMIGITGTKGKTTTSFMIRDILRHAGYKVGLLGTIDYEIDGKKMPSHHTTPEAIDIQKYLREMVSAGCAFCVMEVSSQGLKLHRVDGIVFDIAVFTNLDIDHISPNEHPNMTDYANSKAQLFKQCRIGIGNIDDSHYPTIFHHAACSNLTYSCHQTADFQGKNITFINDNGQLKTLFQLNQETYEIAVPGYFSVYNALAAIAVCSQYEIPPSTMRAALKNVFVCGRAEMVPTGTDYRVMIDYAHNALSLKNILMTMRRYNPHHLIVLFGCGGNRSSTRRYEMGKTAGKYADFTVITSDNPRYENPAAIMQEIEFGIKETDGLYRMIENRKEAIRYVLNLAAEGDIVILAGKGHEKYQEIQGQYLPFDEREIVLEILGHKS